MHRTITERIFEVFLWSTMQIFRGDELFINGLKDNESN